jgi:hypothetical protein
MLPALDVALLVIAAFVLGLRAGIGIGYRAEQRRSRMGR